MTGRSFEKIFQYTSEDAGEAGFWWVPPAWMGPPRDELGWTVPLSLVVGRSDRAVIALRDATAYSGGIVLDLVALARGLSQREAHRLMHERHLLPEEEHPAPSFLRIGVELADGNRASNLGTRRPPPDIEDEPEGPVLMEIGGGGGSVDDGSIAFDERYWLWPLPPPGPLGVYVEWPAFEVALSSVEIDADSLRAASQRSVELWSDG